MRTFMYSTLILALLASSQVEGQISGIVTGLLKPANASANTLTGFCNVLVKLTKQKNSTCDTPNEILATVLAGLKGNTSSCSLPGPLGEKNLTVVVDLEFKDCMNVDVGCNGDKSVIVTVLSLVGCILKNVPGVVSALPGVLSNTVGADLQAVIAMLGLVLFAVVQLVSELLCSLNDTLILLLCPGILFILLGLLTVLTIALPGGVPGLGALLAPILVILNPVVPALIGGLTCLVGAITTLLRPAVAGLAALVTALLATLFGNDKCSFKAAVV